MKAVFNFQIKLDDKQATVLFGMEECVNPNFEASPPLSSHLPEPEEASLIRIPIFGRIFIFFNETLSTYHNGYMRYASQFCFGQG